MPVNAATVQLQATDSALGNVAAAVDTDPNGQFTFSGIGGGDWQIQPQKLGDTGSAISALDAVYVLQAAVNQRTLTTKQQLACDVTGNGTVSALDAALILQYKVGLITSFPVAQACGSDWVFTPEPGPASNQQVVQPAVGSSSCQGGAIAFHPLTSQADNQNFSAVLFGDCTGNWTPSGGGTAAALGTSADGSSPAVRLGQQQRRGRRVRVALYVDHTGGFRALDVRLHYDPTQLTAPRVRLVGDANRALLAVNQRVPGVLALSLASTERLPSGALMLVELAAPDKHSAAAPIRILHAAVGEE